MRSGGCYDAIIPFNRFFTSFSLGLFDAPSSHPCIFRMLTVCVTLGLRASTSSLLAGRRAIVLPKCTDRERRRLVERLRLEVHGMPGAVGAGEPVTNTPTFERRRAT